nr:hypothetical protein [Tanacetum cinerariifolium]
MYRTLSAPRSPNPVVTQGESISPRKPTVIRFHVRSQPDPETPIPIVDEIDIYTRSLEDLEAQQIVEKVQEHLVTEEIEQINLRVIWKDKRWRKSDDLMIINDDDEEESAGDALIG